MKRLCHILRKVRVQLLEAPDAPDATCHKPEPWKTQADLPLLQKAKQLSKSMPSTQKGKRLRCRKRKNC